jgi:hypothetical protein
MNYFERELNYHRTGTRWIWDMNLVFMKFFITNLEFILEIRHGSIHSSEVLLLDFSSPFGVLPDFISLVISPSPTIAMSRERGNLKYVPTYYRFMSRQLPPGPSFAPILPPSTDPIHVDSPFDNLPFTEQNWVGGKST